MSETNPAFTIRKGTAEDVEAVHGLIVELAIYERAGNEVTNDVTQLRADGFGPNAIYELWVAEVGNEVVGMALWYVKYSTWKGKCGFLEDLVVRESHRGLGYYDVKRGADGIQYREISQIIAYRPETGCPKVTRVVSGPVA